MVDFKSPILSLYTLALSDFKTIKNSPSKWLMKMTNKGEFQKVKKGKMAELTFLSIFIFPSFIKHYIT